MHVFFANLSSDIAKLSNLNNIDKIISFSDSASRELRRKGLPFVTYQDYLTSLDFQRIDTLSRNLMKSWQNYDKTTLIEGICLADIFINYSHFFTIILRKIYLAETYLANMKPSSVYMTNSSVTFSKIVSQICKNENIKCVQLNVSMTSCITNILTEYLSSSNLLNAIGKLLRRDSNMSGTLLMGLITEIGDIPNPLPPTFVESCFHKVARFLYPHNFVPSSNITNYSYTVLSFCANINAVTLMAPILNKLKNDYGYVSACITMYSDASRKCAELGLDYINISNLMPEPATVREQSLRVIDNWNLLKQDTEFKSRFRYEDYSIFDAIKYNLQIMFSLGGELIIRLVHALKYFLDEHPPRIVIVPEDVGIATRTLVRLAKMKGIPTLVIQHGTMEKVLSYSELISDKMAVWGKDNYELLSHYVEKERLEITGMPRLDNLSDYGPEIRHQIFEQLKLDKEKKLLVWTPSPYTAGGSHKSTIINDDISSLLDGIPNDNNIELVVKVHPLDDIRNYNKSKRLHVIKNIDTLQLIYSCDALLVTNSTSGVEGIAMGKPILYLNFHNIPETIPYVKYGAAIRVSNIQELRNALHSLDDEQKLQQLAEGRKSFIASYLYRLDGKSSERISKLVDIMVRDHQN